MEVKWHISTGKKSDSNSNLRGALAPAISLASGAATILSL
jgi:hypothetical protein